MKGLFPSFFCLFLYFLYYFATFLLHCAFIIVYLHKQLNETIMKNQEINLGNEIEFEKDGQIHRAIINHKDDKGVSATVLKYSEGTKEWYDSKYIWTKYGKKRSQKHIYSEIIRVVNK